MADYRYAVGTVARATTTGAQVVSVADAFGTFPIKEVIRIAHARGILCNRSDGGAPPGRRG